MNVETLDTVLLAVIAIAATIPAYYAWADRRFKVDVFKSQETVNNPILSHWSIKIMRPSKVILRCQVFVDGIPLRWADKEGFERYFGVGTGGVARIPKDLQNDESKVEVKDGSRTITKPQRFKDMLTQS